VKQELHVKSCGFSVKARHVKRLERRAWYSNQQVVTSDGSIFLKTFIGISNTVYGGVSRSFRTESIPTLPIKSALSAIITNSRLSQWSPGLERVQWDCRFEYRLGYTRSVPKVLGLATVRRCYAEGGCDCYAKL
jgi:hypothetical protein